ncbi:transmembrane protein 218 isoform X1 [Gymnogyps californianus]|uniref:transmembrane protein 218 isoform X1 n=1 Tax=Gymnogyps californianus TaxID=33616 RepID=UPI0021C935E0|nr:transmembrane protein 218 isoform X1 [Gymnogyps californianus]
MAGTVLGVGPGVLVLQLLWGLALLLCLALSRTAGRAREGGARTDQAGPGAEAAPPASPRRFAVVLVTLGAAVLSAALLLFPREDERPATAAADEIVDTFFIGRFVLLALMSLVLLGCLFLLLIYHLMEPVYAKPLHSS